MDLFNELAWYQFKILKEVRDLPLNEQVDKYNKYLWELSLARDYYLQYQVKGPHRTTPTPPVEDGFLLQEDLFDLLQETGDKIIITT
jgi:hypothetical protein